MTILSRPYFHDEEAAFAFLEGVLWPTGPVCPKCGATDRISVLKGVKTKASKKNPEGVVRHGLKKCGHCKAQFTVRVGSVFESSHVELTKWLQAVFLLCSSKKGLSSHQLMRVLEVTYKTAWFMSHRIREAMRTGELAPFGGSGTPVEVDETFIGNNRAKKPAGDKRGRGYAHKYKVLALVDRETGKAKTMIVDDLKAATLTPILKANIAKEARVMTDEAGQYIHLARDFAEHHVVRHGAGEYGRGEAHTNTVEGYFFVFKRGMKGVYQHCGPQHLHCYVAEFEFRYNNRVKLGVDDQQRAVQVLRGIVGKRLTYRGSSVGVETGNDAHAP